MKKGNRMKNASKFLLTAGLFFSATAYAAAQDAAITGDAAAGEKVYKKCVACHAVEEGKKKVGPHLFAIIDRPAATVDGFKYSKAMIKAAEEGLVWDIASLSEYLVSPKKMIKGTKMTFAGLKKPEDIENVIAYLAQFTKE